MFLALSGIFLTESLARANQLEPVPNGGDGGTSADPARPTTRAGDDAGAPPQQNAEGGVEVPTAPAPPASPPLSADAPAAQPEEPPREGKKKKKGKDAKEGVREVGKEEGAHAPATDHPTFTSPTFGSFEIKGRVYARAEFDRRDGVVVDDTLTPRETQIESFDLTVPTARLSLHYRAPEEWLSAMIEIDVSGKPDMKDGYVQAKSSHFTARAGQFKVPVSPLATTSPWTLPFVRRGFLHEVLVDRLDYGGRRPGFMVGYRDHSDLHPKLTLGAFQGSVLGADPTPTERDMDLLEGKMLASQSLVARGEIELLGVEIGAYFQDRIGSPSALHTDRYWTAGADITFERMFPNGGLRVWIDGIAGASWYEQANKPIDRKDAIFTTARALVAYRFGGTSDEAFYVEPYGLIGGFDPDADVKDDLAWEGVLGVNVGLWKRARASLQGEVNGGMRNFPDSYYVGRPPQRVGLIAQAGVAF